MKPQRKCKKIGCKANTGIAENTIFVEPSLKSRLPTTALCTNVHFHRCFAHTVFEKRYKILKILTKITPKKPEGSKNGPETENIMKPP